MEKISPEKLAEIIESHDKWLVDDPAGKRANLKGVNLESANLWCANLMGANLESANLWGANLESANLDKKYIQKAAEEKPVDNGFAYEIADQSEVGNG